MKAWSDPSARRLAVSAVAGLSAVVLLGGCGFATRQQAAAVVNGDVINESDVHTTYEQLQAAKLDFPENVVVTALIAAPLLKKSVNRASWQPDDTYASAIASISQPTETTKEFVTAVALIQSNKMTPADVAAYRKALGTADISISPKYGRVVQSDTGPVYFSLGASTPNWIKTGGAAAAATTAPSAG